MDLGINLLCTLDMLIYCCLLEHCDYQTNAISYYVFTVASNVHNTMLQPHLEPKFAVNVTTEPALTQNLNIGYLLNDIDLDSYIYSSRHIK